MPIQEGKPINIGVEQSIIYILHFYLNETFDMQWINNMTEFKQKYQIQLITCNMRQEHRPVIPAY